VDDILGRGGVVTDQIDVLLVDGDDEIRTQTARALRSAGHRVESARDADEAAIVMKLCDVHALAIDARSTGLDALSLLADLGQHPAVILLSAYPFEPPGRRRIASVFVHAENTFYPSVVVEAVCHAVARVSEAA